MKWLRSVLPLIVGDYTDCLQLHFDTASLEVCYIKNCASS